MLKDKIYDRKVVKKPWGFEYVALRNKNKLAITFLNINYKKKHLFIAIHQKKLDLFF